MPSGSSGAPPRWSLQEIYPGFDSREYLAAVEALGPLLDDLRTTLSSRIPTPAVPWLKRLLALYNEVSDRYEELFAFAYTQFSVNTRDERAQKEMNRLERAGLPLKSAKVQLRSALLAAEREAPGALLQAAESDPELSEFRFFLAEQLALAEKQMTPAEENLAADLSRSGGDAWGRLHEAVSSSLQAVWDEESGEKKTAVELRMLAFDPERSIRARAFERELEAWRSVETPLAFALNGVKGFSVTLNARRSYATTLDRSIVQSRISRQSLDALIGVMRESLPQFRGYLRAKARALRVDRLAFYDLFAPVGPGTGAWPFDEARKLITDEFSSFSRGMGDLSRRAFAEKWIDALSREGKVGGAYCISFPLSKASRVLCNYNGTFDDLTTVAHELGHAYHHEVLKEAPAVHRDYPMTLAETASIFAENIIFTRAVDRALPEQRISILDGYLQSATQVIVDILSRFLFEEAVLERRPDGELSPRELCELMVDAQKETYGDALDGEKLHPYMWAVKGHYYSQDLAFYNFPYAFGQLFGLALFGLSRSEGEAFPERYRRLLAQTGRTSAVELTRGLGFDIERPEFWRRGMAMIGERIDQFAALAEAT
ncbi:MAG TPA: M3 family oligoendopeptidase [Spirochaetia bacterium]|nr:M3 family oligoendopeptidase [Spirochaetia bacterium]